MQLPPPDALVAVRPPAPTGGPERAGGWAVEARFQPDGQPDEAELAQVLDELWRARHHHPTLWRAVPGGWRPMGAGAGAAVSRLLLWWDLGRPGVEQPSEADLQGRLGALERALLSVAPCILQPTLPVAVAAARAAAIARLRRAWGQPLVVRLIGGPRGLDAAGAWLHLRDHGLQAGADGWLRYGLDDPAHPPAFTIGTSGPPGRLDPPLLMAGDLRLTDLVFRFQPALSRAPRALCAAVVELATALAGALEGTLVDAELAPLDPARLQAHIALVEAGLRRSGLTPGNSATVRIFGAL